CSSDLFLSRSRPNLYRSDAGGRIGKAHSVERLWNSKSTLRSHALGAIGRHRPRAPASVHHSVPASGLSGRGCVRELFVRGLSSAFLSQACRKDEWEQSW